MRADPLGLVDGASVYGYAGQNPGGFVDPRGEDVVGGAIVTGLGAAVVDGPLPFGDFVGLCIVGAAVLYCAVDDQNCSPRNDYCQEQYEDDVSWCSENASGREYIGCIARAEDNLFTCRRGGPRKPRVPEIYEQ